LEFGTLTQPAGDPWQIKLFSGGFGGSEFWQAVAVGYTVIVLLPDGSLITQPDAPHRNVL
jgi:hypothetical protein